MKRRGGLLIWATDCPTGCRADTLTRTDSPRRGRKASPLLGPLAQDPANDETDIRRPLAQPAHEIREPFASEWHIDAHPVTLGGQRRLQIAPHPVQHLKLVPLRRDAVFGRVG